MIESTSLVYVSGNLALLCETAAGPMTSPEAENALKRYEQATLPGQRILLMRGGESREAAKTAFRLELFVRFDTVAVYNPATENYVVISSLAGAEMKKNDIIQRAEIVPARTRAIGGR